MSVDAARAGRLLVLGWLAQLAVSSGLLLWASTGPRLVPRWCGILDVTLALTFVGTSAVLRRRQDQLPTADRLQRQRRGRVVRSSLPSLVLLGLWVVRDRLEWNVLLPGLAWRLYFVLHVL
jgi:hypothetical protein